MNDSKTRNSEVQKTPLSVLGIDDPSKLAIQYDPSFSLEDTGRILIECSEVTFLTDCARIRLKRDDLLRFINKTKRIVINGVSFIKEDEFGDGE